MKKILSLLTVWIMATGIAAGQSADARVLILLAHPDLDASRANKALAGAAAELPGVQVIDLYATELTPGNFRGPLAEASAIVFQFPFYWASAPSELKRWTDEVFTPLGELVQGKKLMVVTTTGSDAEAYRSGGRNRFTMDELLRPYQLTANHSGMVWQSPVVVHSAGDQASIREGIVRYLAALEQLLAE